MKSNTQNKKIEVITEKTLVIGIDVGSETHYARAFDYRGYEFSKKPFMFSNDEAGFETFKAWILDYKEKYEKEVVVPGMEPTGHYWFNLGKFLQDNGMKPVLVNPHHVKKSKELDDNNPTKNDRKDPKVIAGLIKDGRYMIPYLPDGVYADLRIASNMRFQLQSELTRIQNRISRWFSIYFPEYKNVYGKPDAMSGMMILKGAPLPEDIVALGVEGVNKIWRFEFLNTYLQPYTFISIISPLVLATSIIFHAVFSFLYRFISVINNIICLRVSIIPSFFSFLRIIPAVRRFTTRPVGKRKTV